MEFKVTLKSGERGEEPVTRSVVAGDEQDAAKWGEYQMKAWGWANGTVIKVERVGSLEAPAAS